MSTDPLAYMSPELRAQMRELFLDEALTLVEQLETALLTLERAPDEAETLQSAFRAAHTIKGSAASIGLADIAGFTHELESALDGLRSQRCELTPAGMRALLLGVDLLREQLGALQREAPAPPTAQVVAQLQTAFRPTTSVSAGSAGPGGAGASAAPAPAIDQPLEPILAGLLPAERDFLEAELRSGATTYQVAWKLHETAFALGLDPLVLLRALAGEAVIIRATPLLADLPDLSVLEAGQCYLGFTTLVATTAPLPALQAVFEFCPAEALVDIIAFAPPRGLDHPAAHPFRPTVSEDDAAHRFLGEILVEEKLVRPEDVERALSRQRASENSAPEAQTLRVKQSKLDGVIDLVGELVTTRNTFLHLLRTVETDYDLPDLARRLKAATGGMNWIVNQLQSDVLGLRMVPARGVFQRLQRPVRDVAAQEHKQVALEFSGADTELDKTVADMLVDPLLHLVRNAVDHGLETPAARQTAGKPAEGRVTVTAARQGNSLVVEVCDDGQGLDPDHLRRVAVRRGLLTAEAAERLPEAEAFNLIFLAGFSTRTEVSEVSGRGVGMDIVRSNVARMGGTVTVKSDLGHGTNVRLQLPLTLSLFRGLMLRAAGEIFSLPLEAVRETVALSPADCHALYGRPFASIRGQLVGLVPLGQAMGLSSEATAKAAEWSVVIVEAGGEQVGLIVEAVDPPQDIMVKPLDDYLAADGLVAGASILGDGRVALVLDPAGLVRFALSQAQAQRMATK